MTKVTVVGAGLAGSECAWQLAERGVQVELIEQKPVARTPAQQHDFFAELVCSNSFRGAAIFNAVGLLKEEMRRVGSIIMQCGELARVPAGGAFAVDREVFGRAVTERLHAHPNVTVHVATATSIPERGHPVVLATGPLTADSLAAELAQVIGTEHLAYYDAIAPVVSTESIDWDIVFKASRYDKGEDEAYGNCAMDEAQYEAFIDAILEAEKVVPRDFEETRYFEGCLPIEVMAERGRRTLAFGPMKPVGITDPRTGRWPHAVVQLRQENADASAYNLVGFQTRMKHGAQVRVFRTIPGLENAEFLRLGSVHRNTFVNSPVCLGPLLELKKRPGVHLAGQISGVEGYIESAACGLVLGVMLARRAAGESAELPPAETALGSLMRHLEGERKDFQPSNIIWSMFPEGERFEITPKGKRKKLGKRERRDRDAARALEALKPWLDARDESEDHTEASAAHAAPAL